MTNTEIIAELENMRKFNYTLAPDEVFEAAISALKSITALSKDIKVFDRAISNTDMLIGFNMAVALFNKHFGIYKMPESVKSRREKATYRKCKECQWLSIERSCIGRRCVNPNKIWKSNTAMWHAPSCKACKMFKPYKGE